MHGQDSQLESEVYFMNPKEEHEHIGKKYKHFFYAMCVVSVALAGLCALSAAIVAGKNPFTSLGAPKIPQFNVFMLVSSMVFLLAFGLTLGYALTAYFRYEVTNVPNINKARVPIEAPQFEGENAEAKHVLDELKNKVTQLKASLDHVYRKLAEVHKNIILRSKQRMGIEELCKTLHLYNKFNENCDLITNTELMWKQVEAYYLQESGSDNKPASDLISKITELHQKLVKESGVNEVSSQDLKLLTDQYTDRRYRSAIRVIHIMDEIIANFDSLECLEEYNEKGKNILKLNGSIMAQMRPLSVSSVRGFSAITAATSLIFALGSLGVLLAFAIPKSPVLGVTCEVGDPVFWLLSSITVALLVCFSASFALYRTVSSERRILSDMEIKSISNGAEIGLDNYDGHEGNKYADPASPKGTQFNSIEVTPSLAGKHQDTRQSRSSESIRSSVSDRQSITCNVGGVEPALNTTISIDNPSGVGTDPPLRDVYVENPANGVYLHPGDPRGVLKGKNTSTITFNLTSSAFMDNLNRSSVASEIQGIPCGVGTDHQLKDVFVENPVNGVHSHPNDYKAIIRNSNGSTTFKFKDNRRPSAYMDSPSVRQTFSATGQTTFQHGIPSLKPKGTQS